MAGEKRSREEETTMRGSGLPRSKAFGAAGISAWVLGLGLPATAQEKPIVIGGTLGLTGILAEASSDYKAVYERWEKQINDKGGLLGRPVKLIVYNDESTPTVAQSLYNRLLD